MLRRSRGRRQTANQTSRTTDGQILRQVLRASDIGAVETMPGSVVASPIQLMATSVSTYHELPIDPSPLPGQDVEGTYRVRGKTGQVCQYPSCCHPNPQAGVGARADPNSDLCDVG